VNEAKNGPNYCNPKNKIPIFLTQRYEKDIEFFLSIHYHEIKELEVLYE